MNPDYVNSFGLGLNIIGGIILFFYGPAQPSFEEGVGLGLEDATMLPSGIRVAQHNEQIRRLRAKHKSLSRIGLALLVLGFAIQLWAIWL